ncbi:MAK10-like protein [Tanacetum coccineum]
MMEAGKHHGTRVEKKKGKEYKILPGGPAYEAILKKKITKKQDIKGEFLILPCWHRMDLSIGERPPSIKGIAEDVLVEVAEHIFPVDFVILDIKENEKSPFILGTPFLTTAKATIKFDTGTITLRLVLEWEERIKLHLEKEMKFNQWRSNNFKNKQPAPVKVEGGMDDEEEVT